MTRNVPAITWRRRRARSQRSTATAICWCGGAGRQEPDQPHVLAVRAGRVRTWLDPATGGPRLVKLLRTIRLDPSDTRSCSSSAAAPGEWAVPGRVRLCPRSTSLQARGQGARGVPRRGSSASTRSAGRPWRRVVEASEERIAPAAVELLAQRLVERFGAPDLAAAQAGGRGGDRLRRLALRPPRQACWRHVCPQGTRTGRSARRSARWPRAVGPKPAAGLRVPRGCGGGGSTRQRTRSTSRPLGKGERANERSARLVALLRPPLARSRRGRRPGW